MLKSQNLGEVCVKIFIYIVPSNNGLGRWWIIFWKTDSCLNVRWSQRLQRKRWGIQWYSLSSSLLQLHLWISLSWIHPQDRICKPSLPNLIWITVIGYIDWFKRVTVYLFWILNFSFNLYPKLLWYILIFRIIRQIILFFTWRSMAIISVHT